MPLSASSHFSLAGMLLALAVLSGCATNRPVPETPAPHAQGAGSGATAFVKIVRLSDQRNFLISPSDAADPALNEPRESMNPAITSRVIANKRDAFGKVTADVLLPEGSSVQQVVGDAVRSALTPHGYTVVDKTSAEYADAAPISVDIWDFWSWSTPGVWATTLEFEIVLRIRARGVFLAREEFVRGYARVRSMAETDAARRRAMRAGVADLIEEIETRIAPPPTGPTGATGSVSAR